MEATGSVLTNKYSEGYPGKRYYGGNEVIDQAEELARDRVKALFGAEHANVQPHSGANANMAVYLGLLDPGDTVLGLRLDQGGHLTHGSPVNASGILYNFVSYGVTPSPTSASTSTRSATWPSSTARRSSWPAPPPTRGSSTRQPFREIADEVGALFMFDAAHIAGLIAGGVHPNPVPLRRHRHLHHPQDAPRPARRLHPVARPSTPPPSTRRCSPARRAARSTTSSRPRRWRSARPPQPEFTEYAQAVVANAAALAEAPRRPRPPARSRAAPTTT